MLLHSRSVFCQTDNLHCDVAKAHGVSQTLEVPQFCYHVENVAESYYYATSVYCGCVALNFSWMHVMVF